MQKGVPVPGKKARRQTALAMSIVVILSSFLPASALADIVSGRITDGTSDVNNRVDDLTRQILAKEFELEKLNARFRPESTHQDRWRPWRMITYAEGNAAATGAGLITAMALFYPTMGKPHEIWTGAVAANAFGQPIIKTKMALSSAPGPSKLKLEGSQIPQLCGQAFGAMGDVIELGINTYQAVRLRDKGFDGNTYRKRVRGIITEMDQLLANRALAVKERADLTPAQVEIASTEGRILKDYRDLALLHYNQYHASARKLHVFQNAAYMIDFAKNSTGFTGNIVNIYAQHRKDTHMVGGASLLTLISGALIVATPIFGRVTGNMAGLVDRRIVGRDYANAEIYDANTFTKDRQHLEDLVAHSSESSQAGNDLSTREKIYTRVEGLMVAHEENIKREQKQAKKATIENVAFGTFVGGTKIALGVCGMLAGWKYYDRPWVNHALSAAGNTAYAAGTWTSFFENARVRGQQVVSDKKLRKENLSPGQVLVDRLRALDEMESTLKTSSSVPGKMPDTSALPMPDMPANGQGQGS